MKTLLFRNLAALIDACLAALFATVCYMAAMLLCYQTIPYGGMIFFATYLCLPVFFKGKSIGKILFHNQIEYTGNRRNHGLSLFLREIVLKIIVFMAIPYFILVLGWHSDEYLSILYVGIVSALLNNMVYLFGNKYIWDYVTNTCIVRQQALVPKLDSQVHWNTKFLAHIIDVCNIIVLSMLCYLILQQWMFVKFYLLV